LFFIAAFYFTPPIQFFVEENTFKNPIEKANRYPLDTTGLSEKRVILSRITEVALEYRSIPFAASIQ